MQYFSPIYRDRTQQNPQLIGLLHYRWTEVYGAGCCPLQIMRGQPPVQPLWNLQLTRIVLVRSLRCLAWIQGDRS